MKYFITLIIGQIIGYWFCIYMEMPSKIEERLKNLDLMNYDAKTDKFIPKDCVVVRSAEINYLIKGTTKND